MFARLRDQEMVVFPEIVVGQEILVVARVVVPVAVRSRVVMVSEKRFWK